jgi:hypothetical protein
MAMTIRTSQLGGMAAATGTTKLLHIYDISIYVIDQDILDVA